MSSTASHRSHDHARAVAALARAPRGGCRHAADLARLVEAQTTIASAAIDQRELMQLAPQRTQALVGASGASIELVEGDELAVAAASGVAARHRDLRLRLDGSLSGQSLRTGQPLVSDHTETDPRVDRSAARRLGVRSIVVAPLRYTDRVVGVLNVLSPQPRAFDAWRLATLQLMAAVLGAAIGQARALAEQARAEAEARESAERLAATLRAATELAIIGTDREGRVTFFNEGAEKMLGYRAQEILGRQPTWLFHDPEEVEARTRALGISEAEVFVGAALRGAAETHEWTYVRKDGSRLTVSLTLTGMRTMDGTLIGFLGVAIDVTERKAIERMKDELISVISHELRTPVAGIRAALGLLAGGVLGPLPERGQRMLELAVRNTDRLIRLLDDILDLERMRRGRAGLDKRPSQLGDLMVEARDVVSAMATHAQVDLEVEPITTMVVVDPRRLVQVLTELLDNAIRFSAAGTAVCVRARLDELGRKVRIEVQDHGRGIPGDQLERIFAPFHQVDASDARTRGGTGLGLAICRAIVELHDGRIWAESTVGAGSTLVIELPLDA